MPESNIRLTSGEIGYLWLQYMNNDVVQCILTHLGSVAKDTEIIHVLQHGLSMMKNHNRQIENFFATEDIPVPLGYKELNAAAPQLFSEPFPLFYLRKLCRVSLQAYGTALSMSARKDVRDYFSNILRDYVELNEKVASALLAKGIFVRSPFITVARNPQFAAKHTFVGRFLGKDQRPLTAIEIGHVYTNIQNIQVAQTIAIAFSQVSRLAELRKHFNRGKDLCEKHIDVLTTLLRENDTSAPMHWDSDITASTTPPFSDNMMLFHVQLLCSAALANYGASLSTSLRSDLTACYTRLGIEVMEYMEDGLQIMLSHGWVEEPPQSIDRDALALSR